MAVTRIEDVVNKDDEDPEPRASPSQQQDSDRRLATVGKKRTRTGCLNCRRKRRKCDEAKPTCEGCVVRKEFCEWGVKVSFRPENAQTMRPEHPSMKQAAICGRNQSFQIINVTKEVIRDYFEEIGSEDVDESRLPEAPAQRVNPFPQELRISQAPPTTIEPTFEAVTTMQDHLSHQPSPILVTPELATGTPYMSNVDLFLSPQYSDSTLEDGIFLPGSQYQELHAALRSRIIDTARSTAPSRVGSPEPVPVPDLQSPVSVHSDFDESRRLAHLTAEEEYVLWQNYIDEVAPWCDKFDINRHFELVLPMLAKSHPHLRYSILALSARQVELKAKKSDNSCSLALYQHAIHLLSPRLHERTSAVLGSCIVLAVLEMMSCSPKAWRRHLDGCAALIQALGIHGGSGALDQALFWCFARMDICGGLISSERTLIPVSKWMSAGDLMGDYTSFQHGAHSFDMYANRMVYLCGQVVDLLCSSGKWEQRHVGFPGHMDANEYIQQWSRLFEVLDRWYQDRPEEMKPLLTITSPSPNSTRKPFPTLLYGNGPAVSGNQMYHTAALLMLKHRPSRIQFAKKPQSILWHARQICAISISNTHHGCWTNSIQPLWVAGQHMSHPSEHGAILQIYERIERETGWATKWRRDDLREYWGELDD